MVQGGENFVKNQDKNWGGQKIVCLRRRLKQIQCCDNSPYSPYSFSSVHYDVLEL